MNLLQDIFLKMINMGITASYVIIAVLLIRLCIRKAPKVFSYALWSVVGFRLICPISFSSVLSIFNFINTNPESNSTGTMNYISSNGGDLSIKISNITAVNDAVKNSFPTVAVTNSVNPIQVVIFLSTLVWMLGIIGLLIYSMISFIKLRYRMKKAVLLKDNIYECDSIPSPFVMGILKPRIYIPFHLSRQELDYILLHEKHHIKRFDYLIKPFSFLLLIIYWYNPLVWIAYSYMCKDMEMSCDEKVINNMGMSIKSHYSMSLLTFASNHRFSLASPLTFGETNTKSRIKNILNFKKPKAWISIMIGIICLTAVIVCTANPSAKGGQSSAEERSNTTETMQSSDYAKQLFDSKNSYIGNNSADGKLLNTIGVGNELGSFTIEMETTEKPYVLRLNFSDGVTDRDTFDSKMCNYATILLALISNADEIQWSYPNTQDGETQRITVYWNDQNLKAIGIDDIKSYGESVTQVQALLDFMDTHNSDFNVAYANNVTDNSDGKPQDEKILIMNDILDQKDWGSLTIDYFKAFDNAVMEEMDDQYALNSYITFSLSFGDNNYELQVSFMKEDNRIDMILLLKESDSDVILLFSDDPKYKVNTDVEAFLKKKVVMSQYLTYQLPDSFEDGKYSAVIGDGGGNLFYKDGKQPEGAKTAPVEWTSYGGVKKLPYEKFDSNNADYNPRYVTFENGKLIRGGLGGNHQLYFGEPDILDHLSEQAVIMEVQNDLYTLSQIEEAKDAGNLIPEADQTSTMYEIYFAREDGNAAYCIFLNEKYFTYQQALTLAKSVKFTAEAFE